MAMEYGGGGYQSVHARTPDLHRHKPIQVAPCSNLSRAGLTHSHPVCDPNY